MVDRQRLNLSQGFLTRSGNGVMGTKSYTHLCFCPATLEGLYHHAKFKRNHIQSQRIFGPQQFLSPDSPVEAPPVLPCPRTSPDRPQSWKSWHFIHCPLAQLEEWGSQLVVFLNSFISNCRGGRAAALILLSVPKARCKCPKIVFENGLSGSNFGYSSQFCMISQQVFFLFSCFTQHPAQF